MTNDRENWDAEVVVLCDAINAVPGLRTTESCSGHGEAPLRVWLESTSTRSLFALARPLASGYGGCRLTCAAEVTDLPDRAVVFRLESLDRGAPAYAEADRLAGLVRALLANTTVRAAFGF